MVELTGPIRGPVIGVDSKKHYKEWFNQQQQKKEFRGLLGVALNPLNNETFEGEFDAILDDLFQRFGLQRKRRVYSASEIGSLLTPRVEAYKSFCLNFARGVLSLKDVKVTYFVTRININYLQNGKVTIFGRYGTATTQISVHKFIDKIYPYYNVICAWKLAKITGMRAGLYLFDGTEDILPCNAWEEFSASQYLRIIFSGDKTVPVIASADLLLRSLDFFLQQRRGILDEEAIRDIVLYRGAVPKDNKFFVYIGNPDLDDIKPLADSPLSLNDLKAFIHHPLVFLSAGDVAGQKSIIETLPLTDRILSLAADLHAGVRVYHPKKDRFILGNTEVPDQFVPLNEAAGAQLQALQAGGLNVTELKL